MNPFLYDTVAKPLSTSGGALLPFSETQTESSVENTFFEGTIPLSEPQALRKTSRRAGMMALVAAAGVSSFSAQALDVNSASQSELQAIKGVGPRTAQIIVQERQRAGHFESLQDLSERVRGIGLKKLQSMQQAGLTVGTRAQSGSVIEAARDPVDKRARAAGPINPIVTDVVSVKNP